MSLEDTSNTQSDTAPINVWRGIRRPDGADEAEG